MNRAEARLRARGGGPEEGALEASRCFLRAMLIGLDEDAGVPDELVARVSEFLKIDVEDFSAAPVSRRASTRPPPPSLHAGPGERRRRVLFLGRSDAARVAICEAVARATLGDEAEVRAASLTPAAADPRAIRALRHAGYATDAIVSRAVTVDDLSWADLVVTFGGDRESWERFLPRSIAHQHEQLDDPIARARGLAGSQDEDEPFRATLRAIERVVLGMRPPRSSRMPAAPVVRTPPSPRMAALSPQRTPIVGSFLDPRESSWPPSSGRVRAPK